MALFGLALPAAAHPVPFTFLDVRLEPGALELTLVAHVFDVAHELQVNPPDQVLVAAVLNAHGRAIAELLRSRLQVAVNGTRLTESE